MDTIIANDVYLIGETQNYYKDTFKEMFQERSTSPPPDAPMHTRYSEMMNQTGVSNELRALLVSHEDAWREVIRDQKTAHAKAMKQLQEKFEQDLALKMKEMENRKLQHQDELQALEAQLEYNYTLETMKLEAEIKALRSGSLQAQGGLVEEMNVLRASHEEALREQQRRHEAQLLEVTMNQETTLKRLEENLENLSLALAGDIEQDLLAQHEYRMMEVELNHADEKQRLEAKYLHLMDNQSAKHEEEVKALELKHQKVRLGESSIYGYVRYLWYLWYLWYFRPKRPLPPKLRIYGRLMRKTSKRWRTYTLRSSPNNR